MKIPAVEMAKGHASVMPCDVELKKNAAYATRALQTLSAGNRTLLRASAEQELLRDMCHVIVDTGGYRMAFVAYAEHNEQKSVRWMVGVGCEMSSMEAFPFTWSDTEYGRTATGTAMRTGKAVVGRDILHNSVYAGPEYALLLEQAVQNGYASITAFPLHVDGHVIGALVIGASESDAFDAGEVALLGELADDLSYGISNLRIAIQHKEARTTIERLAFYDTLTGLPNRTLLLKCISDAMAEAKQQHRSLALLHLEVGRFHEINKVLGYKAGDELLLELSRRLANEVLSSQKLARVGETEFAILLPGGGAEFATDVAQRLLTKLREPVEVEGLMLDAHVDIGIALYPGHAHDADALIRRANAAMHMVKPIHGGYAIYTGGQEKDHTRRLALMGDLRRAIDNSELRLYCQPKIGIDSRRMLGAEALVRWEHPVHGMISTTEFIQLAEQAGMITPLTNWILEAAFSQSYAWNESGTAKALAINLSAHDLYDPRLVDRIRGMFATWGIRPELIQFELTESALMADKTAALETLRRLKKLDVKLFVDDYGTGYSSLSYLQQLPVDAIKIDQSFVMPMVTSVDSAVIVSSTIELGHHLGMQMVAEGVESQAIWDRLDALGCDVAQGYFISKPMPAEALQQWEREWA